MLKHPSYIYFLRELSTSLDGWSSQSNNMFSTVAPSKMVCSWIDLYCVHKWLVVLFDSPVIMT